MRTTTFLYGVVAGTMLLQAGLRVRAADDGARPSSPNPRDLREELTPPPLKERADPGKDLREPRAGVWSREELEKRREEWKQLSPEEREARLKQFRERWRTNHAGLGNLTPEERKAKRKEMMERFDKQLNELRQRKADGALTPPEARRLERMEEMFKRFQQVSPRPLKDDNRDPHQPARAVPDK